MSDLTRITTHQTSYHPMDRQNDRGSISSSESSLVSPISPMSPENNINWENNQKCKRSAKQGVSAFIGKLFSMINDRKYQYLISWNPKGTSFLIFDASRFSQEVLPEYFKHSNFSSFVRQLNMYGFHKINKSPRSQRGNSKNGIWEFSHIKFQRGCPELLEEIKRKSIDSELLRRETGGIHASFTMLQLSQAQLQQQFNSLQEHFEDLLHSFEDMRRTQLQQQNIINKLAEREGIHIVSSFDESNKSCEPSLLVTSPSSPSYKPLQGMPQEVMALPMYPTQKNQVNDLDCEIGIHNTLTHSPVTTTTLPSPSYSHYDQSERDKKKYVSLGLSN